MGHPLGHTPPAQYTNHSPSRLAAAKCLGSRRQITKVAFGCFSFKNTRVVFGWALWVLPEKVQEKKEDQEEEEDLLLETQYRQTHHQNRQTHHQIL